MKFDSQKFVEELDKKWKVNRICPICGNNNWSVNDTIFELPEFQGGDIVIGSGKLFPVIPVICESCGYTIFINALRSGVVKPQEDNKNGK